MSFRIRSSSWRKDGVAFVAFVRLIICRSFSLDGQTYRFPCPTGLRLLRFPPEPLSKKEDGVEEKEEGSKNN